MEDRSGIIIRTPSGEETSVSEAKTAMAAAAEKRRLRRFSNGNQRKESYGKNKQEIDFVRIKIRNLRLIIANLKKEQG